MKTHTLIIYNNTQAYPFCMPFIHSSVSVVLLNKLNEHKAAGVAVVS